MQKRRLGKTELFVSEISLGALPIQRCTMEEAGPVLQAALSAGVNFIDTARAYTDSEAKIGRHISRKRQEYILATKSMARERAAMAKDIDLSLEAMATEQIDLYQIHNIKHAEDLERVLAPGGALEALEEAKAAGKIAHIGVTGHNMELLVEAIKTERFSTVQAPFNFVERTALETLFPLAKKMDIGTIVMKPLGGGQIDNPALALRFVLSHDVSVVIPGMDEIRHIEENLAAAAPLIPLQAAEEQELQRIADEIGPAFCRRCGYCMPCTVGIDIPQLFIFHLQYVRYNMKTAIPGRYAALPVKASACTRCGVCEKRCPYDIPIRKKLAQVAVDLG